MSGPMEKYKSSSLIKMPKPKNSEKPRRCEETTWLKSRQISLTHESHQSNSACIQIGIKNRNPVGKIQTTNPAASNLTLVETCSVLITQMFLVLAPILEVKFQPCRCNKTNFMKSNLPHNAKFLHSQLIWHQSSKKKLKCFRWLRGSA